MVVCGAGIAGVELSLAFKRRWSDLFNTEIQIELVTSQELILPTEDAAVREIV